MKIEDTLFACDLEDILDELINQLRVNNYPYLQKGYKRSGDSLQVQCPYHAYGQEHRPSFGIRRSDGMGHCFACGKVVTLPEFITACFEKNDVLGEFGRRWLKKNFLSLEVEERKDVILDFGRGRLNRSSTGNTVVNHVSYITEEELDKYRYTHPYWKERGITDVNIIELFDLGYDAETDSVTFPVRNIEGNCLFVARRSVRTKFFNYPQGVEKPVYGLYELHELAKTHHGHFEQEIIICESMIDALTCWQYGKYAVALNGLGNNLQFRQLRELPCRKFILATDNDEAGQKARNRIRRFIHNKIITEYVFPKGKKDINELTETEFKNLEEIF